MDGVTDREGGTSQKLTLPIRRKSKSGARQTRGSDSKGDGAAEDAGVSIYLFRIVAFRGQEPRALLLGQYSRLARAAPAARGDESWHVCV